MRLVLAGPVAALLAISPMPAALAQQTSQQTPAAQKVPDTAQAPDQGATEQEGGGTDEVAGDEDTQAPVPFEGGTFTITQTEEYGEKTLSFDGKQVASNYVVYFDKIVELGDTRVALFDVGDGGNACGPAKVIAWKPKDRELQFISVGEDDCGAPPAAVTDQAIYFVPYLMPGASAAVLQWAPDTGLVTAGTLAYTPEPGTGWNDVDPSKYQNIVDAFHNEAVYKAAQKLLGNSLTDVATGLLVGGGTERTPSGMVYASGCVPHACGSSDAFMAMDLKKKALYFAQQGEKPRPDAWPPLKTWPQELKDAADQAIGGIR